MSMGGAVGNDSIEQSGKGLVYSTCINLITHTSKSDSTVSFKFTNDYVRQGSPKWSILNTKASWDFPKGG